MNIYDLQVHTLVDDIGLVSPFKYPFNICNPCNIPNLLLLLFLCLILFLCFLLFLLFGIPHQNDVIFVITELISQVPIQKRKCVTAETGVQLASFFFNTCPILLILANETVQKLPTLNNIYYFCLRIIPKVHLANEPIRLYS